MAEPARKFKPEENPRRNLQPIQGGGEGGGAASSREQIQAVPESDDAVYDNSGVTQSDPVPRTLSDISGGEGGGAPQNRQLGVAGGPNDPNSASKKQINEAENQAGEPDKGKVDQQEEGLADKLGKGFTGSGTAAAAAAATKGLPPQVRFLKAVGRIIGGKKGLTKKKAATGGVLGFLVGGAIFMFSIAQGPLQVIHLGEVLAKSFGNQDNASSTRMRAILKYARSGDYAETRLTYLESKLRARALPKLDANGIRFIADADTAQLRGVRIDHKKNPLISGLSENEAKSYLANEFGVDEDKVRRIGGTGGPDGRGAIFAVTEGAKNMKFGRMMIASAFGLADVGKTNTALGLRPVANALGRPSMFHPWKKLLLKAEEKTAQKLRDREKDRQQRNTERSASVKALNDKVRSKLGEDGKVKTSLVGALGVQAGICIVHDIADAVPKLKRGNVAEPAASLAGDALGQSSQAKSGDDISPEQPGAAVRNYTDKDGKSIWQAQALQALAGKPKPSGDDLETDLKEGFSAKENGVEKTLDAAGADVICSAPAQAIGAIAGVAIIASGPGGVLVKVGSSTINMVASSAALYALTSVVSKMIAGDTPIVTILQGPLGGNIAAYGSRELANMAYRPAGAVEMSKAESKTLALERKLINDEEMASKSFAQRLFDPYDYRSLLGNIIDYQTLSPSVNTQKISSLLSDPLSAIKNFSSLFFFKAGAVSDENYDWGDFREFAISKQDLENPDYQDSPENARIVRGLLDSGRDDDFVDRGAKCFGVRIEEGSKGWDVIKDKELMAKVDPGSEEYRDADCNDRAKNWIRLRFFVKDTGLVKQDECLNGDPKDSEVIEICNEIGMQQPSQSTAPTDDAEVSGSTSELARELLDLEKDGKIRFNVLNSADNRDGSTPEQNIKDIAAGKEAKTTTNCSGRGGAKAPNASTPIKAGVLEFLVGLAKGNSVVAVNALAGQCHSPTSNHYKGTAVDLDCNPDPGKARLDQVASKYGGQNNGEVCPGNAHYHYDF